MEGLRTSWAPSINIMEGGDGHHDPSQGPGGGFEVGCFGFAIFMALVITITTLIANWLSEDDGSTWYGFVFFVWIGAALFYWRSWFKG